MARGAQILYDSQELYVAILQAILWTCADLWGFADLWANGVRLYSVGKNKGGTRQRGLTENPTEIETAGSGKDLVFWLWPPWEPAAAKAAPYAIEHGPWPHPSPAGAAFARVNRRDTSKD